MIEGYKNILQSVCKVTFVDPEEITSSNSRRDVINARILLCYHTYSLVPDYNIVSRSTGIPYKQVWRYISAFSDKLRNDPIFKLLNDRYTDDKSSSHV
jgi:hypothetical protein